MTQYKYQTNLTVLVEGEIGLDSSNQLVTKDGGGSTVVLGNPANSTAVVSLTPTYAPEVMDISSLKTLGAGFIFLNGTSFDAMGGCDFEFEEQDGTVYGLYGRTNGPSQRVYFSAAFTNQQDLAFTTVPYVPPWLSGNIWQAAAVVGGDVFGFTLALYDTSNATTSLRYVYVKHNGSLINTAGHTYVEITPVINSFIAGMSSPMDLGGGWKIVRVGAYYFCVTQSWDQGYVKIGGWNAQDSTYPFGTATFPASSPAYTPTTFTIQLVNWPGTSATTSATALPIVLGNSAPGNNTIFQLVNYATGAVSAVTINNYPLPPSAAWIASSLAYLDGEVDGSGNVFLAVGTRGSALDVNSNGSSYTIVYSVAVTFNAGSAGAYTNALFTYNTPGTGGTDLLHTQPTPFSLPYGVGPAGSNANFVYPDETVASNASQPITCVNKLPLVHAFDDLQQAGLNTGMNVSWYYSGFGSLTNLGGNQYSRGRTQLGTHVGSAVAAQTNKLATIYPQYNVNPRFNFGSSGPVSSKAIIQPSGILSSVFCSTLVQQDTLLTSGVDKNGNVTWAMSIFPTGSNIADVNYVRNGVVIPGFRPRILEYPVAMPVPTAALHTTVKVWPVGIANINSPTNMWLNSISDSAPNGASPNNVSIGIGSWTLSAGSYAPPSGTVWTTAATFSTQLAALKATAFAAAGVAYSDTGTTLYGIEVLPVMDSTGTGIAFALGVIQTMLAGSPQTLQHTHFTTGCSVTAGVVNLTNTSSVNIYNRATTTTGQVFNSYSATDVTFGTANIVWTSSTAALVQWSPANAISIVGDQQVGIVVATMSNTGSVSGSATLEMTVGREHFNCSPQLQGLCTSPYLGVSFPGSEFVVSRYTTSAVNTVADFAASFNQAISSIANGTPPGGTLNIAELLTLTSINNTFLLQIGVVQGRLNHKEFSLPSSFIDMTAFAVGTYYLYATDSGTGGVILEVDSAQRAESATNLFFGKFDRTSSGFANTSSVSEVVRFGTARLVQGSAGNPVQGSSIRLGPYVG